VYPLGARKENPGLLKSSSDSSESVKPEGPRITEDWTKDAVPRDIVFAPLSPASMRLLADNGGRNLLGIDMLLLCGPLQRLNTATLY
jgi:hypothetical protein